MDTQKDPQIGKTLPSLNLPVSSGGSIDLGKDLKGRWNVLYFYPKDDTPGCTAQACNYRDRMVDFKQKGIGLYGVSGDNLGSHEQFIGKYSLNFPLIADTENKLGTALGVYGEQEWQGKKYMGLSRDSFLIDPQGKIHMVWRKVNPSQTAEQTFNAAIESLGTGI